MIVPERAFFVTTNMFNYIAIAIATASLAFSPAFQKFPTMEPQKDVSTTISAQNPIGIGIKKPAKYTVRKTYKTFVTAYTSRPEETDSTPYITASGTYVREGVVATNDLPIGTLVRIPSHFGDKIFRVEDRMNAKYTNELDIWFSDLGDAREFGKKFITIEVL